MAEYRFRREEHLKRRSRIKEVFGKGKRYFEGYGANRGLGLFVLKNNVAYNRICFSFSRTDSRKFGSAVARNRAKRLVREAFRLIKANVAGGHDLIVLINSSPFTLSERTEQLQFLFKKAGLIK